MKRYPGFGLLLLLAMLLSACASQAATDPVVTEPPAATETTVSEEPAATEAVQETSVASGPAECRPYNLLDEILGAPDPNLAPITAEDHTRGPEDARMTILEFSDFQ